MLLLVTNKAPALGKLNILLKSLHISSNYIKPTTESDMILLFNMNVRIAGTCNITKNRCSLSIMRLQSCDILLSGKIIFDKNNCAQVILLDTYIKVMEYTNITFKDNSYQNNIISIQEIAQEYHQPYPFCFIQYIAVNNIKRFDKSLFCYLH